MGSRGNPYDHSATTPHNGNPAQASAYNRIHPFSMPHHNIARPRSSYEAYPLDASDDFLQGPFEEGCTFQQGDFDTFRQRVLEKHTHLCDKNSPGSSLWITLFNLYNSGNITPYLYESLTNLNPDLYESNTRYITNLMNLNLISSNEHRFYVSVGKAGP